MNVQTNPAATHSADATTVEEGLAIQEELSKFDSEAATELAMQNTLLTPRFYTTDFDELDAIDVSSVREDWDSLIAQMVADPNKGHFKKNDDWDTVDWDGMEPHLKKEFIDFLVNRARSFIYTTALPAPVCAAASKAIDIISRDPELAKRLWDNVRRFKAGLRDAGISPFCEETHIIPIIVGGNEDALAAASYLHEEGFFVPAIRPPTVPEGGARLRITLTAMHTFEEIDSLVAALKKIPGGRRR